MTRALLLKRTRDCSHLARKWLRVRSCQSVSNERALSSDEEIILQRLKDMGVQVHETYIELKHGALSSYEAELRTPLSQYLQQRRIIDGTEFD